MSGIFRHAVAAAALVTLAVVGTGRSEPPAAAPVFPTFPAVARAQPAAQPTTLPFPAKAPVVLQLSGIEQARERLTKMLTAALPTEGPGIAKQLDAGLKQALEGRKLTAVPKAGRVFVVLHDIAKLFEDEVPVSVLVPVTSYKEFQATFLTADERKTVEKGKEGVDSARLSFDGAETNVLMVDLKDYVALTTDRTTADTYAGKYTKATTAPMGGELAGSFLKADVSIYVNIDEINSLYGEQIRQFKGLIDFALMQAQMGGMVPGLNKQQMEAAKMVLGGMFQGIEDCQGVVLAAEFRPEGLNFRLQAKFADDTASAKMLAAEKPTPLAELAKFPKGMSSYGGGKLGPKFAEVQRLMGGEFSAADDDEKTAAAIAKLYDELAAAGPGGEFAASDNPDTGFSVTAYKNADRAFAAAVKLYKTMPAGGRFQTVVLKDRPKVTENAQTHRGIGFTEIRLAFDFDATVAGFPENIRESTAAALKRVLNEKTAVWVGTDGKVVYEIMAKDWDAAKKVLDDYADGKGVIGTDPGFLAARKQLPADATLITLTETTGFIIGMVEQLKSVSEALPGGGGLPPIGNPKRIKTDPTFIGLALTLRPGTATVDVFVPTGAIGVGAKMLSTVFRSIE